MNKFNNHNQQPPADSPNLNSYFILPYIGILRTKLGKRIAALFRDELSKYIK